MPNITIVLDPRSATILKRCIDYIAEELASSRCDGEAQFYIEDIIASHERLSKKLDISAATGFEFDENEQRYLMRAVEVVHRLLGTDDGDTPNYLEGFIDDAFVEVDVALRTLVNAINPQPANTPAKEA